MPGAQGQSGNQGEPGPPGRDGPAGIKGSVVSCMLSLVLLPGVHFREQLLVHLLTYRVHLVLLVHQDSPDQAEVKVNLVHLAQLVPLVTPALMV